MKKVIICSISIGLVLLLGITALVLALIPVNKNSVIEKPNAVYIINDVTWDTTQKYYDLMDYKDDGNGNKKDQPKIDEIFRLFNSSFGQNALTALFRGQLNEKMEQNYSSSNKTDINKNSSSTTAFTVYFQYKEMRKIVVDGKEYEYNILFFEVAENDSFEIKNFGTIKVSDSDPYAPPSTLTSSTNTSYKSYYTARADFSKLYDYINEIVNVAYGK